MAAKISEAWGSRLGVILAVAGSAVGLGNFLRFPGQAAQYGGGAFMIAYFISLLILGIPICWVEWTMGRYGGMRGFNSCPGIFHAIIRRPIGKYLGVLGVIIPVVIYMYYVYIEAWCLGYAANFLLGNLDFGDQQHQYAAFWARHIGMEANGSAFGFGLQDVGPYLVAVFAMNFYFVYRGLSKGIEFFCKYAMPALVVLALIILVRVLTLGVPVAGKPEQNIENGLGYMWNPQKILLEERVPSSGNSSAVSWRVREELVGSAALARAQGMAAGNPAYRIRVKSIWDQLSNPQLWLAAAGQIFFSLSVGFGVIIVYSSYLKRKDDIVLSGLTATAANEFCEVALGGLITLPAAFVFLGAAGVVGQGTFELGFKVLPLVLAEMPGGALFGVMFFILLFLAAITSSLSMLQPGIAFLEESLRLNRKQSCAILAIVTGLGCWFVVYFSQGLKALDTLDFWVGTFLLFVLATIQVVMFGWIMGMEKGWKEAHHGAEIPIPRIFKFIIKYLCPFYLLSIFILWVLVNVFGWSLTTGGFATTGYVTDLVGSATAPASHVARWSMVLVGIVTLLCVVVVKLGSKRWIEVPDQKEEP